ncbi:MAG: ABC transporter permease, partial [Candidatus Sumerlaeota bacterium]
MLSESDDVVKRAVSHLGFNIVLLSSEQQLGDWYREEFARVTIPESTAEALKSATLETIERAVPVLRWRMDWQERDREVIVLGVGEEAGAIPEDEQAAFLHPVERETVHLGYRLHSALDLKPGDTLQIKGRSFRVAQNNPSRGSVDDLTVYMHLTDAQELLDQSGRINEILALQTPKAWNDVEAVRREISD